MPEPTHTKALMTASVPVVTMLYAALCGVLLIALALNIVRLRLGKRIPLGVGEGASIEQPVRVHGNFTEYAPIPEVEFTLMYTYTPYRTNTNSYPYDDIEDGSRLGMQVQWNY